MKAIVIFPGENPTIKETSKSLHEIIEGWQWAHDLEGLHMELVTYGDARVQDMPDNGSLNIGEKHLHVYGPAVICRKNAEGKYTDVRLCDLGLIQACWTPHRPRLEEKEHREDD